MQTFSAPAPKRVPSAVSAIARLNIGGKLTAAFVAMLLMMAALGGFSIFSMSRVSQLSGHIADRWLPATRLTGELHAYTAEYRLQQSTAFLSFDPMAQAAGMEQVAKLDARVGTILKAIEAMDADPAEKALFGQIKTKWTTYREQHAQMVTLMQQNQAAGILDIYNGAALQTYSALEQDVSKLSSLKENGGKAAIDTGHSIYTLATVTTLVSLAVAMAAAGALLALLLRNIARPLDGMTNAVERLAAGDVAVSVPALDRRDEIGKLARATDSFKTFFAMERERAAHEQEQARQTAQMVEALGIALHGLADGDLTAAVDLQIEGPLTRIRDDFNDAVAKLRHTMVTLAGAATSIHSGTSEIAQSADDLSRRTEHQAANVEETAAAMMEVTQNVRSSAQGAVEASKIVSQAQEEAQTSRQVVVRAVEAMNEIEKSSQQISQIISVIDQIAFQTNLLALNAGVEAARAGDSGRGFAVVANEVRSLALRSAGAAKEITHLISTSTAQVSTGVSLVSQAGAAIGGIVGKVDEINTLVSQIASTAEQQAAGLAQINSSVGEMEKLTQQNAAMVEENTAASRSLAAEADQLGKLVGRFELGADGRLVSNAHAPVREVRRAGGRR